jgi:hypothetical protein
MTPPSRFLSKAILAVGVLIVALATTPARGAVAQVACPHPSPRRTPHQENFLFPSGCKNGTIRRSPCKSAKAARRVQS